MERPEREQVVEEPDARLAAGTARAVEVERQAQRGLGARAGDVRGAALCGSGGGPERCEEDVVLARPPKRDPDAAADHAHDEPLLLQSLAERLLGAEEDEVAVALRAVVPGRDERSAHAFPLGNRVRDVDPRVAQRCGADPSRRTAHARGRRGEARAPPPPPARRPPSRREATRSRRPSRASAGRSDSAAQR